MSPAQLAAIDERHVPVEGDYWTYCEPEGRLSHWPCDAARLLAALREAETLAERGYWYFLMTEQGGPDGSDLDYAVRDDFLGALIAWADDEKRAALTTGAET